jgi:hypothetical protein
MYNQNFVSPEAKSIGLGASMCRGVLAVASFYFIVLQETSRAITDFSLAINSKWSDVRKEVQVRMCSHNDSAMYFHHVMHLFCRERSCM